MNAANRHDRRPTAAGQGLEFQPAPEGSLIRDTRTRQVYALLGWHITRDGRRIFACIQRTGLIPVEHTEDYA